MPKLYFYKKMPEYIDFAMLPAFLPKNLGFFDNSPYGNRTRVSAVRGRRLDRLTNGP